ETNMYTGIVEPVSNRYTPDEYINSSFQPTGLSSADEVLAGGFNASFLLGDVAEVAAVPGPMNSSTPRSFTAPSEFTSGIQRSSVGPLEGAISQQAQNYQMIHNVHENLVGISMKGTGFKSPLPASVLQSNNVSHRISGKVADSTLPFGSQSSPL